MSSYGFTGTDPQDTGGYGYSVMGPMNASSQTSSNPNPPPITIGGYTFGCRYSGYTGDQLAFLAPLMAAGLTPNEGYMWFWDNNTLGWDLNWVGVPNMYDSGPDMGIGDMLAQAATDLADMLGDDVFTMGMWAQPGVMGLPGIRFDFYNYDQPFLEWQEQQETYYGYFQKAPIPNMPGVKEGVQELSAPEDGCAGTTMATMTYDGTRSDLAARGFEGIFANSGMFTAVGDPGAFSGSDVMEQVVVNANIDAGWPGKMGQPGHESFAPAALVVTNGNQDFGYIYNPTHQSLAPVLTFDLNAPATTAVGVNGTVYYRYADGTIVPITGTHPNRDNNPLDLGNVASEIGSDKGFAIFGSAELGFEAAARNMDDINGKFGGQATLVQLIATWSPPLNDQGQPANNTAQMILDITRDSHLDIYAQWGSLSESQRVDFVNAYAKAEGWERGVWTGSSVINSMGI